MEQSQADFEEERYPPPKKRKSTTDSASALPGSGGAAAREVALPIAPASATCQHCPTHMVAAQQQRVEIAELKARMADRDRDQTQCSICLEKWHKYVCSTSAFMFQLPILRVYLLL